MDGSKSECIKDPVVPDRFTGPDSASRNENRRGKVMFFQNGKRILIVVAIPIIECNGDCSFWDLAVSCPDYEFAEAYYVIGTLQKVHLLRKSVRMQRFKKWMNLR